MIEEYPEGKDMNRENTKKIVSSLMVLLMVLSVLTAMLPIVSAGNVTIWGRVTDTGGLVNGAEVTLVNVQTLEEYRATTSNGIYEFTQVGEGYYVIRAESDGHYLYENDTAFRFDGTKNIQKDITLKETPVRDITFYGVIGYETAVTGENITSSYNTTTYTANTQFANIVDGTYSLYWNNTELLTETGNYSIDIQTGHIYIENTSIRSWLNGSNGTLTIDYTYISPVSSAEIQVTAENTIIGRNITGSDGAFSIMVWSYTFNVTVTADGYYTVDKDMYINGDYTQITLTEANAIFGFASVNDNGPKPAKDISAYLYNSPNKTVYSTHGQNGSYSFSGVPDGSYLLIVDADGCIADTSIVTITGSTTTLGEVTLQKGANETTATTITLADWNNMELKKSVMLNPDGNIVPLGNDVSNVWLQIDMKFGNGDAKINQTEVNDFVNWYNSIGPEFVSTTGFFTVNGTSYVSDSNLSKYAVTVEPALVGEVNVTDMGRMWINTSADYSASDIGGQDSYDAELMAAQDVSGADTIDRTYSIVLPSGFELVENSSTNSDVTGYTTVFVDPHTGTGTDTVSMTFEKSEAPVVRAGLKASDSIYTVSEDGNISYYIVKAGAEITFTSAGTEDPNGNPVTYTWDFGDDTPAETTTEKEINHTFAASNDDITVEMTATDAGGLSNSTTLTIKSDGTPPTVAATSSISPVGGKVYAEQNEEIVFNSSGSNDNNGFIKSYFWWFDDGDSVLVLSGENQSIVKSFPKVGVYHAYLNVTDVVGNYRNDSAPIFTVQVNDTEAPTVSFTLLDSNFVDAAGSVKENTTAYFNASSTTDNVDVAANLTFVWDFGDGSNATGMNVSHMYTAIGSYDVNLTVTDKAGNSNNLIRTIVVRAANRPDLSIVSVKFDPTEFEQGSTGKIMVNITNNGEANATSVTVTAYTVDIDGNEKEIGSTNALSINGSAVSQLEVGKIASAEIDWKPGEQATLP